MTTPWPKHRQTDTQKSVNTTKYTKDLAGQN